MPQTKLGPPTGNGLSVYGAVNSTLTQWSCALDGAAKTYYSLPSASTDERQYDQQLCFYTNLTHGNHKLMFIAESGPPVSVAYVVVSPLPELGFLQNQMPQTSSELVDFDSGKKSHTLGFRVWIGIGVAIFLVVLTGIVTTLWIRKRRKTARISVVPPTPETQPMLMVGGGQPATIRSPFDTPTPSLYAQPDTLSSSVPLMSPARHSISSGDGDIQEERR